VSILKNTVTNKQRLLTANGSFDTLIKQPDAEYSGITLTEIAAIVREPQAREKADAAFIIPSTYRKHDGRNHAAQRENGEYWMLAIDVDTGSPSLTEITQAIRAAIGPAACLIYSSSSASMDERKWRALIPVAEFLTGEEYVDAQIAIFDLMQEQGITCDPALSRAGQPIYLPNVPPARRDDTGQPEFYHCHLERGDGYLVVKESRVWAGVEFRRRQHQIAEQRAAQERERRQAERAAKRADRPNDVDPVAEFNDRHTIADLLHKYGYEQHGRSNSYRSPHQSSGSYATKDFGTHWVSLSQSDAAAGIGQVKSGDVTICWGDAFDLFCFYEHNGVMKNAVRAYAQELRPDPFEKVNQSLPAANDDLDDFDYIPNEISLDAELPNETSIPDANEISSSVSSGDTWPTPVRPIDEANLPRRRWVYAHHHIRGFVSVTASAGGIGKTSLTMVEAMAVATGRDLVQEPVKERTNAWIINLEDPRSELELRLAAAMKHYDVKHDDIAGKLFMDGEDDIGITLAVENRDGIVQNEALLAFMRDKIKANNIGLVIIDPFVSVHEVNENSNTAIQVVVAMLRKLARETNAAIHVVHHVRKGNGDDATIDSVRGAGALIGAARAARVINKVSAADAAKLGIAEIESRGLFRVDDGKANLAPPADAAVYRRMVGVKLDNGEWVGVAVSYKLPDQWAGVTDRVTNDILALIDKGPEEGEMWSMRPQDKSRWVGRVITEYVFVDPMNNKTEAQAKTMLREWHEKGLIEETTYRSEGQRKERKGVVSNGRVGEQK
jgi:hypothetical protein